MFDTEKFICEIEARPSLYDVNSKSYLNREVKAKCWFEIGNAMFKDWDRLENSKKHEKVKDLMKKWKAIRDAFVKDHKLIIATETGKATRSKKKYVFYDQLLFLLPFVKGNLNTSSNVDPPTTTSPKETSSQNRLDFKPLEEQPAVGNDLNIPSMPTTSKHSTRVDKRGVKRKLSPTKKFEIQNVAAGKKAALERSVASSMQELINILVQMQKEQRNSDRFGHKAFMISFVPVLNRLSLSTAMDLREKISKIFSSHFCQYDQPSSSHSPMSSDNSEQ